MMWTVVSFCLISLSSPPLNAAPVDFARVARGEWLALGPEPGERRARAVTEAEAFARYRRLPETSEARAYVTACADLSFSPFCPYLKDAGRTPAEAPSRASRNLLYETLRTLDDPGARGAACPAALGNLRRILDDAGATTLHSRALYWTWTCATATREPAAADAARDELWRRYPLSHFTLEVMRAARDPRLDDALRDADWRVNPRANDDEYDDLVRGIEALIEARQFGAAEQILRRAKTRLESAPPSVRLYVVALAAWVGENVPTVTPVWRAGVPLIQAHREYLRRPLLELLFPRPRAIFDVIRRLAVPFDLFDFTGLVHLESALNPRAASHAQAYGLTQMLLPTATDRWRELSGAVDAVVSKQMLYDPVFSLKLGAFDLTRRLETFAGNVPLALASYHAGETAVKRWLAEVPAFGDAEIQGEVIFLNREKAQRSADYVMNVRSRAAWYRALYRRL